MISCNLLVVVYYYDLPNFRMFLYLLNKFWKGKKSITIICNLKVNYNVIGQDLILPRIIDATKLLDDDWQYKVHVDSAKKLHSYGCQQIYKLYYSAYNEHDYTIVFDCKNFLTRNVNCEDFFFDNKLIAWYGRYDREWHDLTIKLFPQTHDFDKNWFNPMTPWIWKNADVYQTIDYLKTKLGELDELIDFCASEYTSVCLYKTIILKQKDQLHLKNNGSIPVYSHHFKTDFNYDRTVKKLLRVGVCETEVDKWVNDTRLLYIDYNNKYLHN